MDIRNKKLEDDLDFVLRVVAEWCVSIDLNGASWDEWDHCYKEFMYGDNRIRKLFDEYLIREREMRLE